MATKVSSRPSITVLMPAYNVEKYIGESIESVLNQTFGSFELLIINDGSTDRTEEIIRSFSDPRIRLINQPNKGLPVTLNRGISFSGTHLIARVDSDDVYHPQMLEKLYHFISSHPDYAIVGSNVDYMEMNGHYVHTLKLPETYEEIKEVSSRRSPFIHSAVMFRKDVILQAGCYDPNAHSFQDHLLWTKILARDKGYNLQEVLMKVRLNPESMTIDERWRPKRFHQIRSNGIERGQLTYQEGQELKRILSRQNKGTFKAASYYSMLGKKFLWNNYKPRDARHHFITAIRLRPIRLDTYFFLFGSFLPEKVIRWLYQKKTEINTLQNLK